MAAIMTGKETAEQMREKLLVWTEGAAFANDLHASAQVERTAKAKMGRPEPSH